MTDRKQATRDWLNTVLGRSGTDCIPLAGDASFRRYFRIPCDGRTYVLMDSPPQKEDVENFVRVTDQLEQAGVRVPCIHYADIEQGFLLLDDFGEPMYFNFPDKCDVDKTYRKAIDVLVSIQNTDPQPLPRFDRELLIEEMNLFADWYCVRHLGCKLSRRQVKIFNSSFERLADNALTQPQVFVHRDYHSKNLFVLEQENTIGTIDYQDAVLGPLSYDPVSLLKDCYVRWPGSKITQWKNYYLEQYRKTACAADFSNRRFDRWFDLMGVQRHLKASGIFARLLHRDGKAGYIASIPRTIAYITECLGNYPEFSELKALISRMTPS